MWCVKSKAPAAGGFTRKRGQRYRRNGCIHPQAEHSAVNREDHGKGQHRNQQPADQRNRPQRDAIPKAHVVDGIDQLLRQRYAAHAGAARLRNNGRHHALHDGEHRQHKFQPVGHSTLCQRKADKQFQRVLRLFDLDKAAAGFHNANRKKQNQQAIADCLQSAVDAGHHAPNLPVLEGLRAFGQQRPNLRQLVVPCGECGV